LLIDYSIYDDSITVIDPSGVQLTGLDKYKSAIAFFQTFVGFWCHCPRSTESCSGIQYRMVYDFPRSAIRVSWHAVVQPKIGFLVATGRSPRPLHIDGISLYQLNRRSGKIVEHRIENMCINNTPVAPPYGIWSVLQQDLLWRVSGTGQRHPVPVGAGIPASCCISDV
jgi:hypothetical protein